MAISPKMYLGGNGFKAPGTVFTGNLIIGKNCPVLGIFKARGKGFAHEEEHGRT